MTTQPRLLDKTNTNQPTVSFENKEQEALLRRRLQQSDSLKNVLDGFTADTHDKFPKPLPFTTVARLIFNDRPPQPGDLERLLNYRKDDPSMQKNEFLNLDTYPIFNANTKRRKNNTNKMKAMRAMKCFGYLCGLLDTQVSHETRKNITAWMQELYDAHPTSCAAGALDGRFFLTLAASSVMQHEPEIRAIFREMVPVATDLFLDWNKQPDIKVTSALAFLGFAVWTCSDRDILTPLQKRELSKSVEKLRKYPNFMFIEIPVYQEWVNKLDSFLKNSQLKAIAEAQPKTDQPSPEKKNAPKL